ncbi:hypothetical protein B0F90DRAFT_1810099 [Multifurca ochricompacta]|uniref:Glutathione S-transferase n=1 Tax=Multifurca ochricompacta TaxID=376703 RepID=A0AAD4M4G6_9AGAM|nr:hypothetical protein B0F90DRAFT_1810099 [Multifurca ochricompacta]
MSTSSQAQGLITLYDIPGNSEVIKLGHQTFGRLGLAFNVVWIEYPDIATEMKRLGAAHTDYRDGEPLYTVPVIHDGSTGAIISDSIKIAAYLDRAFIAQFVTSRLRLPSLRLVVAQIPSRLNPRSSEYFRITREKMFGKSLWEVAGPREQRAELLHELLHALQDLGTWVGEDEFLGGKNVCFADVVVAANFKWLRVLLDEGGEDWKQIEEFQGGRWGKYVKSFEKWESER